MSDEENDVEADVEVEDETEKELEDKEDEEEEEEEIEFEAEPEFKQIAKQIHIISDKKRVSRDVISQSELARVIAVRSEQIAHGGQIFVEVGTLYDPVKIAIKEIQERKCPLTVIRQIPGNINNDNPIVNIERWNVNELVIPLDYII
jgi:DNA-directed RNA polymerase I, II, and III subunit RPABC2